MCKHDIDLLIEDHKSGTIVCSMCGLVLQDYFIDNSGEWRFVNENTQNRCSNSRHENIKLENSFSFKNKYFLKSFNNFFFRINSIFIGNQLNYINLKLHVLNMFENHKEMKKEMKFNIQNQILSFIIISIIENGYIIDFRKICKYFNVKINKIYQIIKTIKNKSCTKLENQFKTSLVDYCTIYIKDLLDKLNENDYNAVNKIKLIFSKESEKINKIKYNFLNIKSIILAILYNTIVFCSKNIDKNYLINTISTDFGITQKQLVSSIKHLNGFDKLFKISI